MNTNQSDVSIHFQDDQNYSTQKIRHPVAVTFHLAFRAAAIFIYLICGLFSDSFIGSFIFIVLFLSMDFWTVKNVTGRVLVGLRWWNYIDDDGKSHWVFESRKENEGESVIPSESQIFWLTLVLCPIIWIILFFISVIRFNFKWFMVIVIAVILSGANLYGYLRCKMGDNTVGSMTSSIFGPKILKNIISSFSKNDKNSATQERNQAFTGTI